MTERWRRCVHLGNGIYGNWGGRNSEVPWSDVADPFEMPPHQRDVYPAEAGRVVEWIKRRGIGSFSRADAAGAAMKCGLIDRQHSGFGKSDQGTMYDALEVLEYHDYIRSFFTKRRATQYFIVNPILLLRSDPEPEELHREPVAAMNEPIMRRAFNHEQKRELWFAAGGRCCICRVRLGPDWHADHVNPWSNGGLTVVSNGMALCPACNQRKHAKVLTVNE